MFIKDIEFDFDFYDVNDTERFEKAYAEMHAADTSGNTASEICKKQIAAVKTFFETVLGEGSYEKLVDKPTNIKCNVDALYFFIDCYEEYARETQNYKKEKEKQYSKYLPKNRR